MQTTTYMSDRGLVQSLEVKRKREDLLPALWTPGSARLALTKMGDVLHDTIECTTEEDFILLSVKSGKLRGTIL